MQEQLKLKQIRTKSNVKMLEYFFYKNMKKINYKFIQIRGSKRESVVLFSVRFYFQFKLIENKSHKKAFMDRLKWSISITLALGMDY